MPADRFACRLIPGISYGEHPRQNLDLYLPEDAPGPVPLVVVIHGGGWKSGGRGPLSGESLFVHAGLAVARIEYRLSQHAPFPAQLDDCGAAIALLRHEADALGLDAGRVVVMGHSAGGHLASLVACTVPGIRAAVNQAGPTDLLHAATTFTNGGEADAWKLETLTALIGCPPHADPDRWRQASPLHRLTATTPPHLLIFADADEVVPLDEGTRFHAAMQQQQAAGRDSTLVVLPGATHVDGRFFDETAGQRNLAFFRRHLG
jgi:acetyl esterase/lipase